MYSFTNMGYDDYECLVCYLSGFGNNSQHHEEDAEGSICMSCISKCGSNHVTSRVTGVISRCQVWHNEKCCRCGTIAAMVYRATLCSWHKKIDPDTNRETPFDDESVTVDTDTYRVRLEEYMQWKYEQLQADHYYFDHLMLSAVALKASSYFTNREIFQIVEEFMQRKKENSALKPPTS